MRKPIFIIAALTLAVSLATADDAGFNFLRIPIKARAAGLGEAVVALSDDPSGLAYNPGGLALIRSRQASASYCNYVADVQAGNFCYLQPAGPDRCAGASLSYLNSGQIKETSLADPTGAGLGTFSYSSLAIGGSIGQAMTPQLFAGATAKFIYEKAKDYSASGLALDLGGIYEVDINRLARDVFKAKTDRNYGTSLALGFSVQNLGLATKAFVNHKEKMPLTFRWGLAYRPFENRLTAALAMVKAVDASLKMQAGAEYWIKQAVALRAGINGNYSSLKNGSGMDDFSGLCFGLGLHFRRYRVDYAYTPYAGLGNPMRFDLTVEF